MSILKPLNIFVLALLALFLASCGGNSSTNVADIGTGGTGVSVGTVTGFGSVYVNGVKYETNGTVITDDDADDNDRISESQLKIGHVMEVKSRTSDDARRSADSMEKSSEVKGPVDSVYGATAKTIKIMGQTVLIEDTTSIDKNLGTAGVAGLAVGDLVEVHGFRDATGTIVARRIERQGAVAKYRVRGNIAAFDTATKQFKIGDLNVDYGTAQLVPTGATLANGMRVKVKADTAPAAGKLTATKVKAKKAEDSSRNEVEGIITVFTSAIDFEVNGQKVTTNANTRYDDGNAADLKQGARVEVKGPVVDGVLTASKIEFKNKGDRNQQSGNIRSDSLVARSVNTEAEKSITVLGQKFKVTAATSFEDKVNDTRPFNITNFETLVKTGAYVQIRAFRNGSDLIASRVEVEDRKDVSVRGALAAGATDTSATLTIEGVAVTVDAGTRYSDGDNRLSDLAAFLAKAPAGKIVKAKSKDTPAATATAFDATGAKQGEVEIED